MKRLLLSVALLFSASTAGAIHAQTRSGQGVRIAAGTTLHVRTIDPVDVNSTPPGAKVRGSLANPLSHGGSVIPRGAPVQLSVVNLQRAGKVEGRDIIDLRVDSITFNGRVYPVDSTISESRSDRKGRRTLNGAGIGGAGGAVNGAIAGGGTGALVGSLLGGGGGAAVADRPASV